MKLSNSQHVFIIDDDPEILALLSRYFQMENIESEAFSDALQAVERIEARHRELAHSCSLILCDLKLPQMDGLGFIDTATNHRWEIPIVMMTAHASVTTAVEALKKGAFDYITKPIHFAELGVIIGRAFQHQSLKKEHKSLRKQLDEHLNTNLPNGYGLMIGKSPRIRQVFDVIERVSNTNSNVLITGESGTGKEMVARTIHQKSSRRTKPFVAINCSAIPDQLLESELFGHKRGAFTGANESRRGLFEEAHQGTLFLDEIGDMPMELQAKLLRFIQDRKIKPVGENILKDVDVRIIAATHKNIRTLIQENKFREDLYYRISVIPIHIPSLRERKEDIPLIANHFLKKYSAINQVSQKTLSRDALSQLLRQNWPGNVRELENTLERAIVLSTGDLIQENDIHTDSSLEEEAQETIPVLFSKLLTLQDLERNYIDYVLQATHHAKEKTAEILGINRKTLYRKEIEYGISKK